jgi:protein involved in ribonucleotide reduction
MLVQLLYISVAGNTKNFVTRLADFANSKNEYTFKAVEISDSSNDFDINDPFFIFVPTYLDGGNGIHSGVKEIMTNALSEQLEFNEFGNHLLGVIGSGNKNFNAQYILTARRYAMNFSVPVIGEYELRGTQADLERIYQNMLARLTQNEQTLTLPASSLRMVLFDSEQHGEAILIDDARQIVSQILPADQHDFGDIKKIIKVNTPEQVYTAQINLLANEHFWMWPIQTQKLSFPENASKLNH